MRHPEGVIRQAFPIEADRLVPLTVGEPPEFQLELPVFEGPLHLLLTLIESRELDVLTVPLAEVADAYVAHLATHPVRTDQLAQFVTVATQLILIKSRSLLPSEPVLALGPGADEGEDELRARLLTYRVYRDAALALGERDLVAPAWRREPRETDLPVIAAPVLPVASLAEAFDGLAVVSLPEPEPPVVVAREVTIGQQIAALRTALGRQGQIVLQTILATGRSRTEIVVTLLAALELVRRREVTASQEVMFGPIILEPAGAGR